MSPLKVCLLMRCFSLPAANQDLTQEQAYAPAMANALFDFIREGLVLPHVTLDILRYGERIGGVWGPILTPEGKDIVGLICRVHVTDDDKAEFRRNFIEVNHNENR